VNRWLSALREVPLSQWIITSISPNHRNNDVADCQGTDKGPDGGGDGFFFAVGEGESQNDEDKEQLDGDHCVIGQRPFHGIGVVEGVAEADEGDAGHGGG